MPITLISTVFNGDAEFISKSVNFSAHTYPSHHTPITGHHTPEEPDLHTTEEDHHNIRDYEIGGNDIEQTPTYGIEEHDRIPGRLHPDYNGFNENEITTKWYPKSTDNRVVPPESEFFATIVGMWNFNLIWQS